MEPEEIISIEDLPIEIQDWAPGTSGASSYIIQSPGVIKPTFTEDEEVNYYIVDEKLPNLEVSMKKNLAKVKQPKKVHLQDDILLECKGNARKPVRAKMPPHLKGLMGEANLRFAHGDYKTAEKMCYEIVRNNPFIVEPYMTLAQLYETTDPSKSLQYHTIVAHLNPNDQHQWIKLAETSLQMQKISEAIWYYSKALAANPGDITVHLRKIEVYESIGDMKSAMKSQIHLLNYLESDHYDTLIEMTVDLVHKLCKNKNHRKAIEVLGIPFQKCPDLITTDMINTMLQLLIHEENYAACADIFLNFCHIQLDISKTEDNQIQIHSYQLPKLPIDLHSKFTIWVIKLKAFNLLNDLIDFMIRKEDVETAGDLFLDVTESLMLANRYKDALKLLIPLIKSKNYSLAAVWLKYADCLKAYKMIDQAIDNYYIVMKMAPQHTEVRFSLAELLVRTGKKNEALAILGSSMNDVDVGYLVNKIKLLKDLKEYPEYFSSVELLISRHCITLRHREEIRAVTFCERPMEKQQRIAKLRQFRDESFDEQPTFVTCNEPTVEAEYQLFREALQLTFDFQEYTLMQKFTFTALTSTRFKNKYPELMLIALIACLYNRDGTHGYTIGRDIVVRNSRNRRGWNLFNALLQRADDLRHNKFMIRFNLKNGYSRHLLLLEGNYALVIGNYIPALVYYLNYYHKKPSTFSTFLLGVTTLQLTTQKNTNNKTKLTTTAIHLFASYASTRGAAAIHETYYNMGRMFHQLGIAHMAANFYQMVLNYNSPLIATNAILDLKREAAYNLHLIYRNAGNNIEARNVLIKYIRV